MAQSHAPDIGKARVAAEKIYGIIDTKQKIEYNTSSSPAINLDENQIRASFKGEIKFEDVWFRYPTRKTDWILRGLSLTLHPDESVAIVGESGCGKSTLVSLLLRFYDVTYGKIYLDGKDIREYPIRLLRSLFGLVQ